MKFKTTLLLTGSIFALTGFTQVYAAADAAAAEKLAKDNGCPKCHAPDKKKSGPALKAIADKYKGKADGEANVIKQITTAVKVKMEDGTEEEHKQINTKDPAALKNLAQWILER